MHLCTKTFKSRNIFQQEFSNIYLYSIKADHDIIKGHAIMRNCISDDFCFESEDLWSIVFPLESEKIIATVSRKPEVMNGFLDVTDSKTSTFNVSKSK